MIIANNGRYGPYLKYNNTFYSIPKDESPLTIGINRAVDILSKPKKSSNRSVKSLKELGIHPENQEKNSLFKGRYGFYTKYKGVNFSLQSLLILKNSLEDILKIMRKAEKVVLDKYSFIIVLIIMAKPSSIKIRLNSTADTGFFYVTKKNNKTMTEKMQVRKYDPVAKKHVMFKEGKIK